MKSLIKKIFGLIGYSIQKNFFSAKASYYSLKLYSKISFQSCPVFDTLKIKAIGKINSRIRSITLDSNFFHISNTL